MSLFETASDASLRSTAVWAAKLMRKMDWRTRHFLWEDFQSNKPARFLRMVAAHFGPDELLAGTATGLEAQDIVVLKNKMKRQANIEDFFARRPRTK